MVVRHDWLQYNHLVSNGGLADHLASCGTAKHDWGAPSWWKGLRRNLYYSYTERIQENIIQLFWKSFCVIYCLHGSLSLPQFVSWQRFTVAGAMASGQCEAWELSVSFFRTGWPQRFFLVKLLGLGSWLGCFLLLNGIDGRMVGLDGWMCWFIGCNMFFLWPTKCVRKIGTHKPIFRWAETGT